MLQGCHGNLLLRKLPLQLGHSIISSPLLLVSIVPYDGQPVLAHGTREPSVQIRHLGEQPGLQRWPLRELGQLLQRAVELRLALLEALRRAHVRLQVALRPSTKQHIQEAGQPTAPGRSFLQSRTLGATRCALCSLRCLRCALQRFPLLVERTPLVMVPVLGPPGFLRLLLEALATLQSLRQCCLHLCLLRVAPLERRDAVLHLPAQILELRQAPARRHGMHRMHRRRRHQLHGCFGR
mmetsp:Transcript_26352/g.55127  ORF Transcript_26352/g.55127 Transcript_26352/m.55127 type:complete len:238 (+) Transcript_26352:1359-2072(+)